MSQFAATAVVYEDLEEALPYKHKHRLFPNRFVVGIACKPLVASGCFAAPRLKPET